MEKRWGDSGADLVDLCVPALNQPPQGHIEPGCFLAMKRFVRYETLISEFLQLDHSRTETEWASETREAPHPSDALRNLQS